MSGCMDETLVENGISFGKLIYSLRKKEKKLVRNIEKLLYKYNSAETAIKFNEICLKEGLLPKYSELRLHDPAARKEKNTHNFRRSLVCRQLQIKKQERLTISNELHSLMQEWEIMSPNEVRQPINNALDHMKHADYSKKEKGILKKMISLNGGKLRIPERNKNYINLSSYKPDAHEEALLQMGLNCHNAERTDPKKKRAEIEILLNSIQYVKKKGEVEINNNDSKFCRSEA